MIGDNVERFWEFVESLTSMNNQDFDEFRFRFKGYNIAAKMSTPFNTLSNSIS